ncbi:uncharacterized protein LOC131860128 [Cryptomeria japonica]|uniref:uncharacterized protein LOC131860128 n=1 Tax=Cryptomeria japonica TaxID=3369 RepID=UPI0027DA97A3|nr:uncharacterized protein LOC131860128 [Cryptomeria japonica]
MENIITRFSVPARIISDNDMAFRSKEFKTFCEEYGITISHSSPYHPQDRITIKKSTRKSPFELVYGKKARLPLDNLLLVHRFMTQEEIDVDDPLQERLMQLVELDEVRVEAQEQNIKTQNQLKRLYDKRTTDRKFKVGDWFLMGNARIQDKGKHDKFEALWLGPYVIMDKAGEDSYFLQGAIGEVQELLVHGKFLKNFFS